MFQKLLKFVPVYLALVHLALTDISKEIEFHDFSDVSTSATTESPDFPVLFINNGRVKFLRKNKPADENRALEMFSEDLSKEELSKELGLKPPSVIDVPTNCPKGQRADSSGVCRPIW